MRLKPYHSFIIFLALVVSAICASVNSYRCTERDIIGDMNRALVITLHDRQDQWLTPDTIEDYRSHLRISLLRETSTLCYVLDDRRSRRRAASTSHNARQLTSSAMPLSSHAIRGYANCSFADVLGISDQRTPLSLTLMAMLWAAAVTLYHRRRRGTFGNNNDAADNAAQAFCVAPHGEAIAPDRPVQLGTLAYSTGDDHFYSSANGQPVRFTPMQHQLLRMFFGSDSHQLTKTEICSALWPKKPDANETFYTLIRRVKPVIEAYGLAIEADRGRAYRISFTTVNVSKMSDNKF